MRDRSAYGVDSLMATHPARLGSVQGFGQPSEVCWMGVSPSAPGGLALGFRPPYPDTIVLVLWLGHKNYLFETSVILGSRFSWPEVIYRPVYPVPTQSR